MTRNKIHTIDDLLAEKNRLRSELEKQEGEIEYRAQYFRENTLSILWSYVNPFKDKVSVTEILQSFTGKKTNTINNLIAKGVRYVLLKTGIQIFKKWRNRKKEKDTTQ